MVAVDMKALLISHGFQPSYEKGFANGLAANGCDLTLVASDRTLVHLIDERVRVINLRGSQDSSRPAWKKAINILRYIVALVRHIRAGGYDVVHLTGLFMTRNVLAGYFEWMGYRLLSQRFFMTVHNILPHGRHGHWYRLLHHFIYRLPHKLVVHTHQMRSALIDDFDIPEGRIVVMPHGVDVVPHRLMVPTPSDALRVLLFGSLSRYKGVDLLLSALAHCPELPVAITLVGESRDAVYAQEIEALIAGLDPPQTVHWHRGFVPETDVAGYFESSDVAVLPYRHIDQSGVLFTAFRFGVPVIATDVGAFRESLPNFAGLIADRPEPVALAACLRDFHARRGAFDRQRIRAHAQSMAWEYCVVPLLAAYLEQTV